MGCCYWTRRGVRPIRRPAAPGPAPEPGGAGHAREPVVRAQPRLPAACRPAAQTKYAQAGHPKSTAVQAEGAPLARTIRISATGRDVSARPIGSILTKPSDSAKSAPLAHRRRLLDARATLHRSVDSFQQADRAQASRRRTHPSKRAEEECSENKALERRCLRQHRCASAGAALVLALRRAARARGGTVPC